MPKTFGNVRFFCTLVYYVITFLSSLSTDRNTYVRGAILFGEKKNIENDTIIYIKGAVEGQNLELDLDETVFDDEVWREIYQQKDLITPDQPEQKEPERITLNVADLLDDLIRQADELVGKPVALMTKDDKVKAIRYLNSTGALLITKSGDKIAKHFSISKYTLYSYLDTSKTGGA